MGKDIIQKTEKAIAVLLILGMAIFLLPQSAHAMDPIYAVLKNTGSGEGKTVLQVWNSLINIANTFVIVLLIAVAFAQILRINVNTYGVKKILPTLIFAIIAANFSFLFCRLMIDFANALLSIFFEGVGSATSATLNSTGGVNSFKNAFTVSIGSASDINGGKIFWFIIGQLLKLAAGVIVLILAFLFLVRNWLIYFLVALAPFCMMAMVLPQTKSIFTQWWSNFMKWVFMPIVSVFWLWVGAQWFNAGFSAGIWLINYVFAGVCAYLALTTPFKMGGAIMNQWGGIGKQLWGRAKSAPGWAATQAGQRLALRGQNLMKKYGYDKDNPNFKRGQFYSKLGGVINVPGAYRAYKVGQKGKEEALSKAEVKTGTYSRFGGQAQRIAAAKAKTEDELANAPARLTAEKTEEMEDTVIKYTKEAATRDKRQSLVMRKQVKDMSGVDLADWDTLSDGDKAKALDSLRRYLATSGVNNLLLQHGGADGIFTKEEEAVLAEGWSKNFIKDFRSNVGKGEIQANYRGGGGIGNPYLLSSAVGAEIAESALEGDSTLHSAIPAKAGQLISAVAGHTSFQDILTQNKADLSKLDPEARKSVEDSLKKMCEQRDQAMQMIMSEGEETIEKFTVGAKLISGGMASGKFGMSSNEMTKTLNDALMAIKNKDMEAIKQLPEFIRGAGMGLNSSNPESMNVYLNKIQKRAEAMQTANEHFQSLSGTALMEARAKLMKDPNSYITDTGQKMRDQNKANATAQVSGQVLGGSVAANPALHGVSMGNIASNEQALSHVSESLEALTQQMHSLTSGPLADPHALSPSAVGDKAEFMNMAKEVMKGAQQGSFMNGATATSLLGDANTRRIFADQLGKATAQALTKSLGKTPLKVNMVNKPTTSTVNQQSVSPPPPQQPQTPPAQEQ